MAQDSPSEEIKIASKTASKYCRRTPIVAWLPWQSSSWV